MITLPIGWVFSLGYFVIPIVPFILYVLASLELIAEEIENPFGEDANDLPVDEICENIEQTRGRAARTDMVKIARHPLYAHPLPEGHRFPMLKYELIPEQLLHEGLIKPDHLFAPEPLSEELVLLTHYPAYWEQLRDLTLPAKEQRRIGFPLTAQLVERELRIAQGSVEGALYAQQHGIAFNVAGGTHHAGSNWGRVLPAERPGRLLLIIY